MRSTRRSKLEKSLKARIAQSHEVFQRLEPQAESAVNFPAGFDLPGSGWQ
jgi:hypothetical protein